MKNTIKSHLLAYCFDGQITENSLLFYGGSLQENKKAVKLDDKK